MGKLITTSILDSYDWLMSCPQSFRAAALKQILDSLNRAPWDPTPAILRGMAFEKKVCEGLETISKEDFLAKFEGSTPDIIQFWEHCRGGRQQAKLSKTIEVNGVEYYIYGKRDIAFKDKTIDIKTTGDYKGPKYYLSKNQHNVYVMCSEIEAFEYMIAEYDDVKEVCTKVIVLDASTEVELATMKVERKIAEFIAFLSTDKEYIEAYETTFCKSW